MSGGLKLCCLGPSHLIDPIRPTRQHIVISSHGDLYAMPSLCPPVEEESKEPRSRNGALWGIAPCMDFEGVGLSAVKAMPKGAHCSKVDRPPSGPGWL